LVLLKFKPETTADQKAALKRGLAELPGKIPEILSYSFGLDAGLDPERNHDFTIVGDFASEKEYQVYAAHPVHQKLIMELVKPILAPGGRSAVQYHTDSLSAAPSETLAAVQSFRSSISDGQAVFADTLSFVSSHFHYTPRRFYNGGLESAAGSNEGSCKVFALGKLVGLSEEEVLLSFGEHYRQVCGDPDGTSHGNIRAFMKHGWGGVNFPDGTSLEFAEPLKALRNFQNTLTNGKNVFADTLSFISANFEYTARRFYNGGTDSAAGANEGSCKVFSLGRLVGLSKQEVLLSFGEHYRQVVGDPDGTSHGNIRAFMKHGWGGVHFPDGLGLAFSDATVPSKRRKLA
jgi:hypothetical protein